MGGRASSAVTALAESVSATACPLRQAPTSNEAFHSLGSALICWRALRKR